MKLYNSHIHTKNSPDGKYSAEDMANAAIANGLSGITVTDHCNIGTFISENIYDRIKSSVADTLEIRRLCSGRLEVGVGIEVGEAIWNREYTDRILASADFDAVLASVHCLKNVKPGNGHLSRIDFSALSAEETSDILDIYYADVLKTASECNFDILSHLTLPLRYFLRSCGRHFVSERHDKVIDDILKTLIDRGKALEVNTSELEGLGLMPDRRILERFRRLGGELVTIGSDAHKPEKIALGLVYAAETLRECSFDSYVYYKNHKPVFVSI